jgi:hypothetical protein
MYKVFAWTTLGFYRGVKLYDSNYKTEYKHYEQRDRNKDSIYVKPKYFYTHLFGYGLFGTFVYLNPFTGPFAAIKELYRLEVNIRGLKEEKKSDTYNNLW